MMEQRILYFFVRLSRAAYLKEQRMRNNNINRSDCMVL